MIYFIVENIASKPDIYGNRYWVSIITSTKTQRTLRATTPHHSNTRGIMADILRAKGLEGWEGLYTIDTRDYPIRQLKGLRDSAELHITRGEDDKVIAAILALEDEETQE